MKILEETCPKCGKNDKWRYNRQLCQRCDTAEFSHLGWFALWRTPNAEIPDGVLLVEVDTEQGSDVALVVIADFDKKTLLKYGVEDAWKAWTWDDVSRYAMLGDILKAKNVLTRQLQIDAEKN